ncbi:MAG TPA: hypothetical protein VFR90_01460 [Methylibium sp.]|uniref:hypothetical protein n=1 Tax=Methylibium sp. TaxID=2067992 RepID=UPI002DBC68DD|nr:hypothetical protein [Methylibium sp.]HEU4457773.1 hypothetical protein [Methylibium sp.]
MTRPIDAVLARLEGHKLRENGRDRWRACCPAHGGSNPSALSIGIGAGDQVLLRCWHGCTVDEVAGAVGLELHDLFPPRTAAGGGSAPLKRRRMLTAGQALDLLDEEMTLAWVCAADLAEGRPLDAVTRERLLLGAARVSMLRSEARA